MNGINAEEAKAQTFKSVAASDKIKDILTNIHWSSAKGFVSFAIIKTIPPTWGDYLSLAEIRYLESLGFIIEEDSNKYKISWIK